MSDTATAPFDLAGKSRHGLRGDYADMADDWTVPQHAERYTPAQHDRWRRLHARQRALLPGRADSGFLRALDALDCADRIPDFARVNRLLEDLTGWTLVGVPGLLPEDAFFRHLAARRFPVTVWLREEHEFDYIVEPDVFHDFFGHVPQLLVPELADWLQAYGEGGLKAAALDALPMLARVYWYTVEFGLVRDAQAGGALRAWGAGILSSPAEVVHAVESTAPVRLPFELDRVLRTRYLIDDFQKTYFVVDSFAELLATTRQDFAPLYAAARALPEIDAGVR